jgi:hypothetical protein
MQSIGDLTRLVDSASLPSDAEIGAEWEGFIKSVGRPAAQQRIKQLMEDGLQQKRDVEARLPVYTGQFGAEAK